MIRKFINTTLTIACIVGSGMIGHDLYIHRREDFYIAICVISGVMVVLYLTGEFDDFIDDTLEPLLQKLLKWFNRRNLMLLIVLSSFTGCVRSQINEDTAYIVSCHKLDNNTKFLYKYEISSDRLNISSYFYSNEIYQVGTPIKLCPR